MRRIEEVDKEFQELADCLRDGARNFGLAEFGVAETKFSRALELLETLFGPDHSETSTCLQSLSDCLYAQRKYAQAIPYLVRLSLMRSSTDGPSHPEVMAVLFKLARCYEKEGMAAGAEATYKDIKRIIERYPAVDHTLASAIMESYARLLRSAELCAQAEAINQQSRDLRQSTYENFAQKLIDELRASRPPSRFEEDDRRSTKGNSRIRSLRIKTPVDEELPAAPGPGKAVPLLLLAVVILGVLGLFALVKVKFTDTAASTATKPVVQAGAPDMVVYKTPDGLHQLSIVDDDEAIYVIPGDRVQGKYKADKAGLQLMKATPTEKKKETTIDFIKVNNDYRTVDGNFLYAPDSIEMKVVAAMREVAAAAKASFQKTGSYVGNMPTYQHPETKVIQAPVVSDMPTGRQQLSFDEFDQQQARFNQLLMWSENRLARRNSVEMHHYSAGTEGDTLYIRGTDRRGELLRGSQPGSAYVIILTNGQIRSM